MGHELKFKTLNFFEEFRSFALKGNVIDLAIGVIIGGAFGKIVDSLVKHIAMPLINIVLPSEQNYTGWKIVVGAKDIPYGLFLGELVNFIIVAFAVFLIVKKFLGFAFRQRQQETAPPPISREILLLTEIRDLLGKK